MELQESIKQDNQDEVPDAEREDKDHSGDGYMKEDIFSSQSENNNMLSVADEKQLSMENLNSQFDGLDGYKTTNAPNSNDKQNAERSPKGSNCEQFTLQKKKVVVRNPPKKTLTQSNCVVDSSEMIFNG